jgi:hypothetical protein
LSSDERATQGDGSNVRSAREGAFTPEAKSGSRADSVGLRQVNNEDVSLGGRDQPPQARVICADECSRCMLEASCRSNVERCTMRVASFWLICATILGFVSACQAEPLAPFDPPFSSERIDRLPRQIRQAVLHRCRMHPEAGHYFATYDHASSVVHLNFSSFQCSVAPKPCNNSGCLHETYVRRHGKFVLVSRDFE